MKLEEAILTRRSVRKFQERDVPKELLRKAIGLACWAPNGSNLQPWKFFVISSREKINEIADALQTKAELMAGWPETAEFTAVPKGVEKNAALLRSAPVLIALGVQESEGAMDVLLKRRGAVDPAAIEIAKDRAGADSNAQTIAAAASHLLLVLHSLGLAGCWMVGPTVARKDMEKILGMPAGMHLFTLIPVGYPAESPDPQGRKPVDEVAVFI